MSDRDDVKQPLDHQPPQDERDEATDPTEPRYPGTGDATDPSAVSPDTAAEPEPPGRHGLDQPPTGGR
ncbi:hypothetical protein [Microbacterium atlanticum]|uniref:hypothetical protein n=1 Tax=Microbacterium atlanticum TaxID=2782168 RepID=UPI001889293C|nr:hypothetical protein [Microbacterium atlanticum]